MKQMALTAANIADSFILSSIEVRAECGDPRGSEKSLDSVSHRRQEVYRIEKFMTARQGSSFIA